MMQPKRPISRSSTPIEFTPLILDLDPEPEIKEEAKQQRGKGRIIIIVFAITLAVGALAYWGITGTKGVSESRVAAIIPPSVQYPPSSAIPHDEKKGIFAQGVKNARLVLENHDGIDILKVLIQDKPAEGITWVYEWTKNNEPFGKTESVRGFKRGDKVALTIRPFDGEHYGSARVLTTEIKNTAPRIVESPPAAFDGKQLTYQVKAADEDGDVLTYSLIEGPPGIVIDQKSGMITWQNVPAGQQKIDLKVKVADGQGGEIVYPFSVNFPEEAKEKLTAKK